MLLGSGTGCFVNCGIRNCLDSKKCAFEEDRDDELMMMMNTRKVITFRSSPTKLVLIKEIHGNQYFDFVEETVCEPYSYFDLPFCPPGDPIPNRKKSFQELLEGDCYVNTWYELRFKMGTRRKLLCEKNLTREEVEKFRDAIANETMYEQDGVNASDLEFPPIQYQVGLYLINHLDFHFLYLGNKVKAIYVMGHYDFSGEISKDSEIKVVNFTYSVFWEDFESKQENQDEVSDLSKHVGGDDHVPYATTAFVICIWLGLLCAVIVAYTYLRKISFGEAAGVGHGDACRCPRYSSLLGAILGVGTQQFIM
ncbi:transmembrane 9 superfamily member 4-like [Quercus lobata]|uniref:transmembrane 9 superfamily member 4-like n=1 Tax=Quercus lobata TaxID=97700 RepID=UPI001246405F|nr:transmembrane 9 superfamily member 4-like [Quercus lobata]